MAMFSQQAKGVTASRGLNAKAGKAMQSSASTATSAARRATASTASATASTSITSERPNLESSGAGGALPHFSNDRHAFDAEFDAWVRKATLRDVLGSGGSGGADLLPEAEEATPQTASWAANAVKSFKEFVPRFAVPTGAHAASTHGPRYPVAALNHQFSQYHHQHQFQHYQQLAHWSAPVPLVPQTVPVQVMQMPMSTGSTVPSLVYHASPHSRCVYFQTPAAPVTAAQFNSHLAPHQQM